MNKASALTFAVVFAASAVSANAQTIRGTVVDDSTKRPIDNAIVTLLNTRGAEVGKPPVRSDSSGRFTLHAGDIGRYRVRVTRIGYQPVTSDNITFSFAGHVHDVTMNMPVSAAKLGTVVVTGTTRYNNIQLMSHVGFELRKSKGNGKFMDSTELARYARQPALFMLEENKVLFNLNLSYDAQGNPLLTMVRGSRTCSPEVWVDGFEVRAGSAALRLASYGADQVHGVEVYSHLQLPPPSLAGEMGAQQSAARSNARCGIIAVWTKAFARETEEREAARRKGGG